jgi:hypothetical protein
MRGWEVDGTVSGSRSMIGVGISGVETWGFVIKLVNWLIDNKSEGNPIFIIVTLFHGTKL